MKSEPPFIGLFLVFLVLKLAGVIFWSWWWVTIPLWGPVAIMLAIFVLELIAHLF